MTSIREKLQTKDIPIDFFTNLANQVRQLIILSILQTGKTICYIPGLTLPIFDNSYPHEH